eukprot:scpid87073/ scgid26394/ 
MSSIARLPEVISLPTLLIVLAASVNVLRAMPLGSQESITVGRTSVDLLDCVRLAESLHLTRVENNVLEMRCNITCTELPGDKTVSTPWLEPEPYRPLVNKSLRRELINETMNTRRPKTIEVLKRCSPFYQLGEDRRCRCGVYNHRWVKMRYEMSCTDQRTRWLTQSEEVRVSCHCLQENSCICTGNCADGRHEQSMPVLW